MNDSVIHMEAVTKVFLTDEVETHALAGIDLEIKRGEYFSISGPSGCGKSTLLSIIGLLDTPTGGYAYDKRMIAELRELGWRPEVLNLGNGFPRPSALMRATANARLHDAPKGRPIVDLTVYENVELPLTYRGMPSAERKKRVQESLEKVGMAHRMKHYPSQLSGGQQQRVAVARALCGQPAILLADEPTGNLDSRNGEAVMDLLRELHREGATICMVTHDPRYARYADRTIHLFDGKVVDEKFLEENTVK